MRRASRPQPVRIGSTRASPRRPSGCTSPSPSASPETRTHLLRRFTTMVAIGAHYQDPASRAYRQPGLVHRGRDHRAAAAAPGGNVSLRASGRDAGAATVRHTPSTPSPSNRSTLRQPVVMDRPSRRAPASLRTLLLRSAGEFEHCHSGWLGGALGTVTDVAFASLGPALGDALARLVVCDHAFGHPGRLHRLEVEHGVELDGKLRSGVDGNQVDRGSVAELDPQPNGLSGDRATDYR